ncbi:MAG: hypothetical protein AAFU65_14930 [Pseudomonadota bacterium]
MEENAYEAPKSDVTVDHGPSEATLHSLAAGQKLIIYAFLLYGATFVLTRFVHPMAGLLIFVALIVALIGVIRTLIALDSHLAIKILYFVMMFLPLLNLLALARVSGRATRTLREAGYKVGFLGAEKPTSG